MDRIPVLRLEDTLVITVQSDMHDWLALALQEDLTDKIKKTGARGVLIDISGLQIVDSFTGRILRDISAVSRLLGAQTVVVGMQPEVAMTLVELGLSLEGVRTALDLDKGMALLRKLTKGRRREAEHENQTG